MAECIAVLLLAACFSKKTKAAKRLIRMRNERRSHKRQFVLKKASCRMLDFLCVDDVCVPESAR